jgi:penicillin-binding protein 1A
MADAGRMKRIVLRVLLALVVAGMAASAAFVVWVWPRCSGDACPSVEALRSYTPPQASRVFDGEGQLVAHLAPERRIVIPLSQMPRSVVGAFLAVEDKRFFRHDGIDYRRVAGALLRNVRSGGYAQGFSTITMQLARNVFPEQLTREKTLKRKAWEVMVARQIEKEFSKEEILEMYLNQIYLGEGLYGVEAAAQGYFGRSARELTPEQAAVLAALPKAPSYYSPRRNPAAAIQRRNVVLSLMAAGGVLSAEQAEAARGTAMILAPPMEAQGDAPFFIAAVRRELREKIGAGAETAGLRVYTALDRGLQTAAEGALKEQIEAVEKGKFGKFRGPVCAGETKEKKEGCLEGMFVALDPATGDVRALVGGRDFGLSQFDRVLQAKRQAGSAFKPFVYASALAQGVTIPTPLLGPGAGDYESGYVPADHVNDSISIDLRQGFKVSSNRAAVVVGERAGVNEVVRTAHAMGIHTPINPYPSTFLGAADVVPIEMVAAYAPFANGGMSVEPRLIQRVEDPSGRVVWQAPMKSAAVLSPETAFLTLSLMQDVVDHGTGYSARAAGLPWTVPAAGKTGTTNEAADVWFVGATPDLVAGVWMGFDQPKRILVGATGGKLAAPVWGRVLAKYYQSHPAPAAWSPPAGVMQVQIDSETGQLATPDCPPEQVRTEWFAVGTEPTEECHLHTAPGLEGWFRRALRGVGGWLGGGRGEETHTTPPRP